MAIKDGLLAEYDHEMGTTRRLLERIPDDKLSWKPHDKSMTLGGLATHLATIPHWAAPILNEPAFDLDAAPATEEPRTSRAGILALFDESTLQTRAWMDKADDEYLKHWTLKRGGYEMFSMPRMAAFKSLIVNHIIHHRGQLSVYLRLNDVAVPAIYGPTADER